MSSFLLGSAKVSKNSSCNEVFLLASILNPNAAVNSFSSAAHLPSVLDRLAGA